jgi:hypothetical protein
MRTMQVERGKTRPNTMMTGHTGYITHARKILKLPIQETPQLQLQEVVPETSQSLSQEVMPEVPVEEIENSEEMAEEETA